MHARFRGLEVGGGSEQSNGRLRSRLEAEDTYLRSPRRLNMHKYRHCNYIHMHSYSSVSHSLASPKMSWLEVLPFPVYRKLHIIDVCAKFFCCLLQLSHVKQLTTGILFFRQASEGRGLYLAGPVFRT